MISKLCQSLKKAEIGEYLKEVTSTMINVLNPDKGSRNNTITLGSTLTTKVSVEGRTIKALLDNGSPVTILSLNLTFLVPLFSVQLLEWYRVTTVDWVTEYVLICMSSQVDARHIHFVMRHMKCSCTQAKKSETRVV